MPRVTLIVNPAAGRAPLFRRQAPALTALLVHHGYIADIQETTAAPHSAAQLAAAASQSSSLVIACGGDGTVHGVLQGLVSSEATLGVLPLGTANALARNLGLPLDPLQALTRLLAYTPQRIPLGRIECAGESRHFILMAGCGPDGALAALLASSSRSKARFGRAAYYAHALRLLATRRWPAFQVEYRLAGDSARHTAEAAALLVSRVPDLGGLFARLTPGASLASPHLRTHLLRAPASLAFPAWFAHAHTGLPNPWLHTFDASEIRCSPLDPRPVLVQADAEPLGILPFTMTIEPAALNLLMPPA